jgi:hypothetical protein
MNEYIRSNESTTQEKTNYIISSGKTSDLFVKKWFIKQTPKGQFYYIKSNVIVVVGWSSAILYFKDIKYNERKAKTWEEINRLFDKLLYDFVYNIVEWRDNNLARSQEHCWRWDFLLNTRGRKNKGLLD